MKNEPASSDVRDVRSGPVTLAVETLGHGEPLVIAHGLGSSRRVVLEQYGFLADSHRLVAFDQRGHGESAPVTDPAAFDPVAMGEDIGAVMDALGLESALLSGESMGAATAIAFALRHPERVTRLLITCPAFGTEPNSQRPKMIERGDSLLALGMEAHLEQWAERVRAELGLDERTVARLTANFARHHAESVATAFRVVAGWVPYRDLSELEALTMPVNIVAWHGDDLHPFALATAMAERMPHASLVVVPSVMAVIDDPGVAIRAHVPFLTGGQPPAAG